MSQKFKTGGLCRATPVTRQYLYRLGGGQQYADVGAKAAMCVNHDRNCDRNMMARARK